MKLGKLPAKEDKRDLRMSSFLDEDKLPEIPEYFGHEGVIGDWRMLGNNDWGCCVFSGFAHESMLLSAQGGNGYVFNTENVLADYSAVTGFDPADPSTDNGTYVRDALKYRRSTGVADAFGQRHKITAYVSISNTEQMRAALYLFGAVGIGIIFPDSAFEQFKAECVWDVVPGSRVNGGHYLPCVAWRKNIIGVSWGKLIEMTPEFVETYADERWAFLSEEFLKDGRSPEGFALNDLLSDLAKLV